jgi:hypothetical protein
MSKEAMKLDDKAVAQILSRLPSPPVGDGSALHAWAMQVVRKLAEQPAQPLTDEQIHEIYDAVARQEPYMGAVTRRNIVRAIEAAHGITGETK